MPAIWCFIKLRKTAPIMLRENAEANHPDEALEIGP